MGMPGVFALGTFDTWSPGYLMFMAATHNGISRLYETFGNSGSADTEERTLVGQRDVAHLVPAEPAAAARALVAAQQQQLRADRPAGLAQPLRQQPRLLPAQLLREEQALDPEGEGRRARRPTCFPANDPRPGAQAELLRVLQKQAVEISRATAAFTVHGAGAAGGRRRRRRRPRRRRGERRVPAARERPQAARRRRRRAAPLPPRPTPRVPGRQLHRPHGSAVLAHRRRAARLSVLGAERPQARPVRRHRLDVPRRLRRAGRARHRREGARRRRWSWSRGTVTRAERRHRARARVFAINHNADNALITLRYRLKDADIQIAEEPFEAGGHEVQPRHRSSSRACRRPISTR